MLLKLLLVLVLFFLSRILFYLFNLGYFANLGLADALRLFVIGIRFDLSAVLIVNAPFIVMNTVPFNSGSTGFTRVSPMVFFTCSILSP